MQKIALVLGKTFLPAFQSHILEIDPSITVIACDYSSDGPAEYPNQYVSLPVGKELATLKAYLKDKQLVAVINMRDYFEKLHGQLVDFYQLPGPSAQAVDQISNKAHFHQLMLDLNLNMFRPRTITCQLADASRLLKSSQFPVMIKPFAGAHSRGVHKLESIADFIAIYPSLQQHFVKEKAVAMLGKEDQVVLIEEYLSGKQVTPICYVDRKSKVHFISLVKITNARDLGDQHSQIVFRTTPSNSREGVLQKMKFILQKIAYATTLKETFLDPEFFVDNDNVFLIEVNVRMGGFRQELAKPAFDINLNRMIVALAMDQEVDDALNTIQSASACEVWENQSGVIKKFEMPKSKYITFSQKRLQVGDEYIAPPRGSKPLGVFYVTSSEKSLSIAKKLRSKVVIEFED